MQESNRAWAWTRWQIDLEMPENKNIGDKIELCSIAVDENMNSQPELSQALWNVRGLNCNSQHKFEVELS